ncbi:hypothetical protein CWT02_1981 [Salmonella enterica subsp. enterica serovar Cubana]|nr:hypothetical protein CWT02_1981 [Salmonella enterica subsp. enterica serovar Cubana]
MSSLFASKMLVGVIMKIILILDAISAVSESVSVGRKF